MTVTEFPVKKKNCFNKQFRFFFQDAEKSEDENNGSDADDYDVDADLQQFLHSDKQSNGSENTDTKLSSVQKTQSLKNNKDSSVSSMIQGILENIKTPSHRKTQGCSDDKFNFDGNAVTNEVKEDDMEMEKSDSEEGSTDDDEESEDEKKMTYRTDMFREAADNFYKNLSTVSFLRKYIYGDCEYIVFLL